MDNFNLYFLKSKLDKLPRQYVHFKNKTYSQYLFYMKPPKEMNLNYSKNNYQLIFKYYYPDLYLLLENHSIDEIPQLLKMNKSNKKNWYYWWNMRINNWAKNLPYWDKFVSLIKIGINQDLLYNSYQEKKYHNNMMHLNIETILCLRPLLSEKKLLKIIFNTNESFDFANHDDILNFCNIIKDFGEYPKIHSKVKNLEEIYAYLLNQAELLERYSQYNKNLNVNERYLLLNNEKININNETYDIVVPDKLHDLVQFSEADHFNNCIGLRVEYEHKILNNYFICGLYKNQEPIVCAMLDPLEINNEIKGVSNHYVSDIDKRIIEYHLRHLILIKASQNMKKSNPAYLYLIVSTLIILINLLIIQKFI
jgi:hypothetical protein